VLFCCDKSHNDNGKLQTGVNRISYLILRAFSQYLYKIFLVYFCSILPKMFITVILYWQKRQWEVVCHARALILSRLIWETVSTVIRQERTPTTSHRTRFRFLLRHICRFRY